MSDELTLNPDEIVKITKLVRYSAQARALDRMKIPYTRRKADGSIVVGREAAARALCYPTQREPGQPAANDDDAFNWSVRK